MVICRIPIFSHIFRIPLLARLIISCILFCMALSVLDCDKNGKMYSSGLLLSMRPYLQSISFAASVNGTLTIKLLFLVFRRTN